MIRSTCFALALLVSTPTAHADENVFLRENLSVEGAQLTLGDLFDVGGETAQVVVARAPAPGQRSAIDVNYVRHLAAEHDLTWSNANGLRRITVSRASRAVTASVLRDMLEGELFAIEGRPHQVQLANQALSLHAPVSSAGGPQIVSVNFEPRSGMLAAEIRPYDGAQTVRVTGRAYATMEIPVLAAPVAMGQEITADMIAWTTHRSDRVRPDAVLDPSSIIGFEARRALRASEPLRSFDLTRPLMVTRGELVTLIFESPGIQLSVSARATENASQGDVSRFVNLQSNRTIEAVVDGPGRARVGQRSNASF
jgi:flagella basal body P-ring formation protein FlgA